MTVSSRWNPPIRPRRHELATGSTKGCRWRWLIWMVPCALGVVLSGCGPKVESDQERLQRLVPNASKTTKVSGKVTVDGIPVKDIWVTLHPAHGDGAAQPSKAQVREDGSFQVSTYLEGDGAPPGDYNITLEWLTYRQIGARWVGPDRLKNQYNDPRSTPFHVTVKDSPVELPPFELKVAGVAAKQLPDAAAHADPSHEKSAPFKIGLDRTK